MNLHDKLQKISSSNKSTWVEDTGKELAKSGVRLKARKIALRVLQILKEKNITQTQLAERMGVARQQVTKIVKGQENITLETIDKIERALDITLITIGSPTVYSSANQDDSKEIFSTIYNTVVSAKSIILFSSLKKFAVTSTQTSKWSSELIHIPSINEVETDNLARYAGALESHDYSRS